MDKVKSGLLVSKEEPEKDKPEEPAGAGFSSSAGSRRQSGNLTVLKKENSKNNDASFGVNVARRLTEGEFVAAGWPAWLSSVAGEAIDGWLPLRADMFQRSEKVEQLHKIFKLCGSPSEDYWKKSKLPLATVFKPQHPYESVLRERCREFPKDAVDLLETLLSVEPYNRGTASSALDSEYFNSPPYACDPSSLEKYPPNKEMDAKLRDEERR
nr:probable serine/threonine-protein kinase At1g54610 [Ipomoea batatas]